MNHARKRSPNGREVEDSDLQSKNLNTEDKLRSPMGAHLGEPQHSQTHMEVTSEVATVGAFVKQLDDATDAMDKTIPDYPSHLMLQMRWTVRDRTVRGVVFVDGGVYVISFVDTTCSILIHRRQDVTHTSDTTSKLKAQTGMQRSMRDAQAA
mmetsp:Transcript_27988/g.53268  ORF Transcript_27988/g.53268 Transcript_27988/m.53268 type:complete len:152 (-) Transcript_27988:292-747(-)